MFCPRCGIENIADDVKFCRACGEDLRLASQALQKQISWPLFLAGKLDNLMSSRYRQNARDGGINIFIGLVCILLGVYYMLTGQGALIFWVVVSLCALLGIGVGAYDVLIYRRGVKGFPRDVDRVPGDLSIYKQGVTPAGAKAELGESIPTNEIIPAGSRKAVAPPSVTESTTRHLDAQPQHAHEKH
jgi:hypothetical protein